MTERSEGCTTQGEIREPLDPELERRVVALEEGADAGADFDAASWFWMLLLGIVGPGALLLWGWFGR